jgi:hypothetical protein
MAHGTPVLEGVRITSPENGYESPTEPPNSNANIDKYLQHRRHNFSSSSNELQHNISDTMNANGLLQTQVNPEGSTPAEPIRKTGTRARIGCYTWTWFTLVVHFYHHMPATLLTSNTDDGTFYG